MRGFEGVRGVSGVIIVGVLSLYVYDVHGVQCKTHVEIHIILRTNTIRAYGTVRRSSGTTENHVRGPITVCAWCAWCVV